MKKLSKTFLGLAVCACAAASVGVLAACGDEPAAHQHNYGDWTVTKPTENDTGYATKTCGAEGCDQKTVTVSLPVLGDSSYTKSGDTAACETGGEATYSYTKNGNTVTFTAPTAATGHIHLEKTDEVPKTCTEDGVAAYWTCSCGKMFSDAQAGHEIDEPAVISAGHEVAHVPAIAADCGTEGVAEHWACIDCDAMFSDENGANEIDEPEKTPKVTDRHVDRALEYMAAKAKTCTGDGWEEYWYCTGCRQKYSDANGEHEIDEPTPVPASHGTLVKVDAEDATCAHTGTAEYWYCEDCNQKFSDAEGTTKISKAAVVPQTAHTPGDAVPANRQAGILNSYDGTAVLSNIAEIQYWTCTECGKKFADADCTLEITNAGAYDSRGGALYTEQNNILYGTGATTIGFFRAETAGCYAFIFTGITKISLIGYMTSAETSLKTSNIYNLEWQTDALVQEKFSLNDTSAVLEGDSIIVYVDMEAGGTVRFQCTKPRETLYSVNLQKTEGENILKMGSTNIRVTENDVEAGVEYTFTAPADSFYQISIPSDSIAYVMAEKNGAKTMVISAGEEKTSYVFRAAEGETFTFYMSADTMSGNVVFPVTYAVTVAQTSLPEVVIGADPIAAKMNSGYSQFDFVVAASAEQAGTYIFRFQPNGPGLYQCHYVIIVNGVTVCDDLQATEENRKTGIWQVEIELTEGDNVINVVNKVPQNSGGNAKISIVEKA